MNEQFSAFLDNEATRDESDAVINALLRDEALRDNWTRQHAIRDALRATGGETSVAVDVNFTARVMQAVADEPVHAASPVSATVHTPDGRRGNVTHLPRRRRHRWRNMAGLAVAASAAGFAFFVTQPLQQVGTPVIPASQTTTQSASMTSNASGATDGLHLETVASADSDGFANFNIPWDFAGGLADSLATRVSQAQAAVDHWSVSDPSLASRLNDLLVEHNGLARGYGLSGATPAFVRVATYGQGLAQ